MATEEPIAEIYVQPGEAHLVSQPTVLRTVLGSCVGITFLVQRLGVGGLCHPMLPRCPPHSLPTIDFAAGRRYVDFAIREMASRLAQLGALSNEVEIKLFGGGDVLLGTDSMRPTVGKLNVDAALRILEEEGLTVNASSLGGKTGVHIEFQTGTGEVVLRRLSPTAGHTRQHRSPLQPPVSPRRIPGYRTST